MSSFDSKDIGMPGFVKVSDRNLKTLTLSLSLKKGEGVLIGHFPLLFEKRIKVRSLLSRDKNVSEFLVELLTFVTLYIEFTIIIRRKQWRKNSRRFGLFQSYSK